MEQLKGRLYLAGGFSLAGSSVIAARILTDVLGTFTITLISLLLAVLVLLLSTYKKLASNIKAMSLYDWLQTAFQALFGIFLFRMFLLTGLNRTSAGEAGILTGATPAITALLSVIVLKEKAGRYAVLGICSTIAGVLIIQGILATDGRFISGHSAGNMLVLCAAACESTFNTLSRAGSLKSSGSKGRAPDPVIQTLLVSAVAMIFCIIPAALEHPLSSIPALSLREWLALIWYGVFITAVAFVFWYSGIKRCTAYTASVFSGMMPLTSLLLSIIIFRERAGFEKWLGAGLIIIGMISVGFRKKKLKQPDKGNTESNASVLPDEEW